MYGEIIMLNSVGIAIIGLVVIHIYWVFEKPFPISVGLVTLGAMNSLAGWIAMRAGFLLGVVVVAVGLMSISLGMVIHDYAHNDTPHWLHHAIRIGLCVFLIGLLVI